MAYRRGAGGRMIPVNNKAETRAPQPGVRYITEDLVRKCGKQDQLTDITTLSLTLIQGDKPATNKKIKYIENLEKLKKLQVLNLSSNIIEKMEKMEKLTRLRELNLSFNKLKKIEGIETLTALQVLNFTGNQIEHVPVWLPKKLKSIRIFKIGQNEIESLSELNKLRPLNDLTQLEAEGNPVSDQVPHYRPLILFYLRSLSELDGREVAAAERHNAMQRFREDALSALESELEHMTSEHVTLKEVHNKSQHELEEARKRGDTQSEKLQETNKLLKRLQAELETKNQLLRRKEHELNNLQEHHSELTQDITFYKLDDKYSTLAKPSGFRSGDEDMSSGESVVGDTPFIGKGRFTKLQMAKIIKARERKMKQLDRGEGEEENGDEDEEAANGRMEQLDAQLQHKQHDLEQAEARLSRLHDELISTQERLHEAVTQLQDVQQTDNANKQEANTLRNSMAHSMDKVESLRQSTEHVEHRLGERRSQIKTQEQYIGQLRGRLATMDPNEQLYGAMSQQLADAERQLAEDKDDYADEEDQLRNMQMNMAHEARHIAQVEAQINTADQHISALALREELETMVVGMEDYLKQVNEKADRQRNEYDMLLRERGELAQKLTDLQEDRDAKQEEADREVETLREKLADIEAEMGEVHEVNKSLQHQLNETRAQRSIDDEDLSMRVQEAQEESDRIKQEAREEARRAKAERAALEKKIAEEKRKFSLLKNKVQHIDKKDDEISVLQKQLQDLQQSNARLQDKLYSQGQKLLEEKRKNVDPEELRRRLDHVSDAVRRGQRVDPPADSSDAIGTALEDLANQLAREKERGRREAEEREQRARREAQDSAKKSMRDAIVQAQTEERERAEAQIQAILSENDKEKDDLRAQLDALLEELEREKARQQKQEEEEAALPDRLLQPSVPPTQNSGSDSARSSAVTAPSTEESESTVPSSQWSKKKQELYDTMNQDEQDLFDELQAEIDELKRLLGMGGAGASEFEIARVTSSIDKKTKQLRDMVGSRKSSEASYPINTPRHGVTGHPIEFTNVSSGKSTKHDSAAVKRTEKELQRAKEEIAELTAALNKRTQQLNKQRPHDKSADSIAVQQQKDEIAELHNILHEQKQHINQLNMQLEQISNGSGGAVQDERIHEVGRGVQSIRSRLGEEAARFHGEKHGRDPRGENRHRRGEEYSYEEDEGIHMNPRGRGRGRGSEGRGRGSDGRSEDFVDAHHPYEQFSHHNEHPSLRNKYIDEDEPEYVERRKRFPKRVDEYEDEEEMGPRRRSRRERELSQGSIESEVRPRRGTRSASRPRDHDYSPREDHSRARSLDREDRRRRRRRSRSEGRREPHRTRSDGSSSRSRRRSRDRDAYPDDYREAGRSHNAQVPGGRPVPTFYGPDGRPLSIHDPNHPVNQAATHQALGMQAAGYIPPYTQAQAGGYQAQQAPGYANAQQNQGPGYANDPSSQAPGYLPTQQAPGMQQQQGPLGGGYMPGQPMQQTQGPGYQQYAQSHSLPQGQAPGYPMQQQSSQAPGFSGQQGPGQGQPQMQQQGPGYPGQQQPQGQGQMSGYQGQGQMQHPGQVPGYQSGAVHDPSTGLMQVPMAGAGIQQVQGAVTGAGYTSGHPGAGSHAGAQQVQQAPGATQYGVNDTVGRGYGDASHYPTTPTRQQGRGHHPGGSYPSSPGGALPFSAPTTPIAGSVSGPSVMYSAPNTPNTPNTGRPQMMSTPNTGDRSGGRLKGILKSSAGNSAVEDDDEDQLVCNVPQHHDLEDYVDKLQQKIRLLKERLREMGIETSALYHSGAVGGDDSAKRVQFEHDREKRGIKWLEKQLKKRTSELEALDLAMESQVKELHEVSGKETQLLTEKQVHERDVNDMLRGSPQRRSQFLSGEGVYDVYEDDYDYEYNPRYHRVSRSQHIQDEIQCLEETLSKRRAEVREGGRLYTQLLMDMKLAKAELARMNADIQSGKNGFRGTMDEYEEIEHRTHEAGLLLIKTEEEVAKARIELEEIMEQKLQQENLLEEVQEVIKSKDLEFQAIERNLTEQAQSLEKVSSELLLTEAKHSDKLAQMTEADRTLSQRQRDMDTLSKQLESDHSSLTSVHGDLARGRNDLDLLEHRIEKRSGQLHSLDLDVERDVTGKLAKIKSVEDTIQQTQSRLRHAEQEVSNKQEQLAQEQRALERVREEVESRAGELKRVRHEVESQRGELESLESQKQREEQAITAAHRDRQTADDNLKQVHQRLQQLRKSELSMDELLRGKREELERLEQLLSGVEEAIGEAQGETLQVNRQKKDEHRRIDDRANTLEARVRQIARTLSARDEEKQELASALDRAYTELQNIRKQLLRERQEAQEAERKIKAVEDDYQTIREQLHDRNKELSVQRERAAAQIMDLESIAQGHYSKANRLNEELQYLKEEYINVKRKLEDQKNMAEKEKQIEAALKELKEDIKTVQHRSSSPAPPVKLPTKHRCEIGTSGGSSSYEAEQQILKQELRQSMLRHSQNVRQLIHTPAASHGGGEGGDLQDRISYYKESLAQDKATVVKTVVETSLPSSSATSTPVTPNPTPTPTPPGEKEVSSAPGVSKPSTSGSMSSSSIPVLDVRDVRDNRIDSGISGLTSSSQESSDALPLHQKSKRAFSPHRYSIQRKVRLSPLPSSSSAAGNNSNNSKETSD